MRRSFLALLLILSLVCGGCHTTEAGGETEENQDAVGLPQQQPEEETETTVPGQKTAIALAYNPSDSLNPFQVTTEYNYYLLPLIYEGLFAIGPDFQLENVLCESYEVDGDQWTFYIKQGVLFHDGTEMQARDVVYSINQARKSTLFASRCANITSCTYSGRYTVRIRLGTPDSQLPRLLIIPVVPRNDGDEENPLGTGRFMVQSQDGTVTLLRNDSWHGGAVGVESIRLSALYQDSELSYVIGAGVIDGVCFEKPFATDTAIRGNFDVTTFSASDFHYLGINKNSGPLSDPLVRQAISAALDRELLVQKAFSGYGDGVSLPVSTELKQFEAEKKDPDALLKQAGYADTDGDGIYNDPEGNNLTLELLVPEGSEMKIQAAEIVCQSLVGSGIQVTVRTLPQEDFQQALNRDDFDLYYGETILNDQFDISQMVQRGGSLCYGGASETLTQAITAWKNALPGEEEQAQQALYDAFQEEMPFVPMAFGRGCVVTGQGVMHQVVGANRNPYYNLHQWAG